MKPTYLNPAVVLAMTATGLAVARSLTRAGVAVYGVDRKRWELGHYSSEVLRPPFAFEDGNNRLVNHLVDWARQQDAPPVLIPADDPYCEFLAAHNQQLREACILPQGYRPEMASAFVDKQIFYRRCLAQGIDLPRTLFPADVGDLERKIDDLRFPAILKPAHGYLWRKRFHGRKVLEVRSRDELLRTFEGLGDLKTGMTIQEVIPGLEREIFVCGCYFDSDSRPQALFTARKTRQYPPGYGSGSLMRSEWQPEVARLSAELISVLGYSGICGTEYKPDPRDGRWKLIEVNPRPTLWFALCRASGCNVVLHAYLDLIGNTPKAQIGQQRDGVLWQYTARDLISLGHYVRRGKAGISECLEALKPWNKEEAAASLKDIRGSLYYPLYVFRQWRAHARGEDTGP